MFFYYISHFIPLLYWPFYDHYLCPHCFKGLYQYSMPEFNAPTRGQALCNGHHRRGQGGTDKAAKPFACLKHE